MNLDLLVPHFLQTKSWASVRNAMGEDLVIVEGQYLRIKKSPKPFKPFGYMEQVDFNRLNVEELGLIGRSQGLSHILLDPVNSEDQVITHSIAALPKFSAVFHRHTAIIDLTLPEEELLSAMHSKWRYNVNLAAKKGVSVAIREDIEALKIFQDLHEQTYKRQGYFGRGRDYLQTVWDTLQQEGKVKIAIASYGSKPLVAWMLFLGEKGIYYPYGGSSEENREVMPTHAIVWEIVKWGKQHGYQFFDLWGVDPEMEGVRRMKMGFGPQEIIYQQSRVVVVKPVAYKAFKLANGLRGSWLKLRKRMK